LRNVDVGELVDGDAQPRRREFGGAAATTYHTKRRHADTQGSVTLRLTRDPQAPTCATNAPSQSRRLPASSTS